MSIASPTMVDSTFQLTPSRRATAAKFVAIRGHDISTHALTEGDQIGPAVAMASNISTHALTEGDADLRSSSSHPGDFNSRPHGGRPRCTWQLLECWKFQLTPSRRATQIGPAVAMASNISTHALTEGDESPIRKKLTSKNFNSRPHGGRRQI